MLYIKDAIDFNDTALRISTLFPEIPVSVIENAFERYFWEDERSDFWEYSLEGCQQTIKDIAICFVAEQCNDTKQVAEIALALTMPLKNGNYSLVHQAGALF
jgi:hypothetical protein